MGRGWHKYVYKEVPKFNNYLSLIIPGVTPSPLEMYNSSREIIVWMHNTPQQFDVDKVAIIKDKRFLDKLKFFIVPSEEHKRLTLQEILIDPDKIYVIPNAVEPLTYDSSKFNKPSKVKLIHTSSADRGLDILYESAISLSKDFRLEIYNDFYPDVQQVQFDIDPRVKFYGKTPKATVREAVEYSHIHAYPSTYPETFCMSQVEAMSAGLLCVTSDLGALPEVSGGYGRMYPYTDDKQKHFELFTEYLGNAIEDIISGNWSPEEQIEYINKTYSWEAIKNKWLEFHEII